MNLTANLAISTVFDPVRNVRRLDVHNGTYRKPVETHAALNLGPADGTIDRVVEVRMLPEGVPSAA